METGTAVPAQDTTVVTGEQVKKENGLPFHELTPNC